MIPLGKQIQTSLRLISVSLSNVLYCIYDVSVVSRCILYLNKILFTLNEYDYPHSAYGEDTFVCLFSHSLNIYFVKKKSTFIFSTKL